MRLRNFYFIAVVVIVIDQITKYLVKNYMELRESISIIGEFFRLTSHRNKGAAFGILQDQRWFFIVTTVIIVGVIIIYMNMMAKQNKKLLLTALSLVLGGAIGNFIDRLLTGEVVDFFHFYFRSFDYSFAIFNVADMGIVIGVGLIILDMILEWKNERRGAKVQHESQ
ncbi:signal peptidase II [Longirhabdus pacifica]|uniref:signal peptidase II n=1 Tax=Longirhabdus pacifica TaxID=2305227 RepID=UPI001008BB72|nr:signal peptidase II [Longirhabdus pacifica]